MYIKKSLIDSSTPNPETHRPYILTTRISTNSKLHGSPRMEMIVKFRVALKSLPLSFLLSTAIGRLKPRLCPLNVNNNDISLVASFLY